MDYVTDDDGQLIVAGLSKDKTHLVLAMIREDDNVTISLQDAEGLVEMELRTDEVEEMANILTEFLATLDALAGRS